MHVFRFHLSIFVSDFVALFTHMKLSKITGFDVTIVQRDFLEIYHARRRITRARTKLLKENKIKPAELAKYKSIRIASYRNAPKSFFFSFFFSERVQSKIAAQLKYQIAHGSVEEEREKRTRKRTKKNS